MKESMMREIENLELKLQLYGGHGLNNLTYDELLHFEHQLESSLHIARAHKVYNIHTLGYNYLSDIYIRYSYTACTLV